MACAEENYIRVCPIFEVTKNESLKLACGVNARLIDSSPKWRPKIQMI